MALGADGVVWLWGENSDGQLGDGATADRLTPVRAQGIDDAIAIAAGANHSIAVTIAGTVRTWGRNNLAQLGNGTISPQIVPSAIASFGTVLSISSKFEHSVVTRKDGSAWGWGANGPGQLGNGMTGTSESAPVQVVAIGGSGTLDVGGPIDAQPVAIDDAVSVINSETLMESLRGGDAGGDSVTFSILGQPSQGALTLIDNTTGAFSYTPATSGEVSFTFKVNDGTSDSNTATVQVFIASTATKPSMAASINGNLGNHTLILKRDGTVWAWGHNAQGQLGDGTTTSRLTPAQIEGLVNIIAVAAGSNYSLALRADGTVWAWGSNGFGQLGDGSFTQRETPVQITGVVDVVNIGGWIFSFTSAQVRRNRLGLGL